MHKTKVVKEKNSIKLYLQRNIMYVILAALIIFFSIVSKNFLTLSNLLNIINQSAYLLIIGVGMCFLLLSGAIDLSIGYQMSLIGVVCAYLMVDVKLFWPIAVVLVILLGIGLSLINGLIYVKLNVDPFLITLATQYVFFGISYMLSGARTYSGWSKSFKFIGQGYIGPISFAIILMLVAIAFGVFLLNRTYFGRYVYGLGGNQTAVTLAGVNVKKMKLIIFGMVGFFTAIGTIVLISRTGSASSAMGPGLEFTVIAGGMLGGLRMGGGSGKISSIIIGLMILQVLSNGMQLMQLGAYPQYVVKGLVLILAMTIDVMQTGSMKKLAKLVTGSSLNAKVIENNETK